MLRQRRISWLGMVLLALSVFGVAGAGCSTQATWPTKPVEIVVAFTAGGATDVMARIVAKHLSPKLGVPVNVVNKPGAQAITGTMAVLSSPPDGYTLLMELPTTSSLHAILKDLPYKWDERTFGPMLFSGPLAIVVNAKSPWNSLKDVTEAAKKDPGSFTWGRIGRSAPVDLIVMQLLDAGGVDISKTKSVAFEGAGPIVTAVAGGHIMLGSDGPASVMPLVQSGNLKVLAVTGDKRVSAMPNVPSAAEAGFPSVNVATWFGLSGPKGLPKNVLDRLEAEAKKITEDPAFAKDMEPTGKYPIYMSSAQVRDYATKEVKTYGDLVARFPGFD